jgi:glycosyltransferase involved in cell wall biosynthesis
VTIRRVLVCSAQVPFTRGGAEHHAERLVGALREGGYEAELTALPFNWHPAEAIVRAASAWRLLDVESVNGKDIDLVVPLKFPTWAVRHPVKVAWVLHQHRSAYNLADGPYDDLSGHQRGRDVRAFIERTDHRFLSECRHVFANSEVVADRLRRFSDIAAEPLLHPPPLADQLRSGTAGDYVLAVGRVELAKRPELVLGAMAEVRAPIRLLLAGSVADDRATKQMIADLGVDDRVELLGHVDDAELLDLYAGALAVLFTPIDEDLGYVALEAMAAAKPLIVTEDAGAPVSFVEHGTTGLVTAAEPEALADAIDVLAADRASAKAMGDAGRDAYEALDLSWANVVERLIGAAG